MCDTVIKLIVTVTILSYYSGFVALQRNAGCGLPMDRVSRLAQYPLKTLKHLPAVGGNEYLHLQLISKRKECFQQRTNSLIV